jgi:threonyl-tRNA synthetase
MWCQSRTLWQRSPVGNRESQRGAVNTAVWFLVGDRLGKLIRTGEQQKIPVLGVIGAKEAEDNAVSLRSRRDGDLGSVAIPTLLEAGQEANQTRAARLNLPAA